MTSLDGRDIELIHRVIDGHGTAADDAELARLLERSPDARREHEQLKRLQAALARIESVPPPATLRPSILRALGPLRDVAAVPGRQPARYKWAPAWLGYAAACVLGGVLVATIAVALRDEGTMPEIEKMLGTLTPNSAPAPTVDAFEVSMAQVSGEFRMVDRHHMPVVEFEIDAGEPVEVVFECTAGCRSFRGFARRSGLPSTVTAEDGRLRIINEGAHSAVVFVGDVGESGATVGVRLFANHTLLHEQSLHFPPVGDESSTSGN